MPGATETIPRTIWILWLQGWKKAPPVVRACLATWKRQNPGWEIHALSERTIARYIDVDAALPNGRWKTLPRDALSDVIRICLLKKYGGVWVDGTVYCNRPLDDWLADRASGGFFAFGQPAADRMIASWFLAAARDTYIVEEWHRATLRYWSSRTERDQYFWFHRLFEQLYEENARFRSTWDAASPLAAVDAQYFVPYATKLCGTMTDEHRRIIDQAEIPVFKLTHKYDKSAVAQQSALRYLVERSEPTRPLLSALLETVRAFLAKLRASRPAT